jgi:hypothetical protein
MAYSQQGGASGWAGWIYFASFMMIFVGVMHAIAGLAALFNDQILVSGTNSVWLVDVTTWGWAHLLLGLLVAFAGGAVMSGRVWGRTIGVILAGLSAIANFAFIPVYPFWAITVLVIDVVIIFALTAHGNEVRA